MVIIDEKAVIEIAKEKNFNLDLFKKYLEYQKGIRNYHYYGKWTVEEYAVCLKYKNSEFDVFSLEGLEWFGNWMGFGGNYSTPDCLSFIRYCGVRDLYPYNEKEITRSLKKDEN